jgi:hypothetical protein
MKQFLFNYIGLIKDIVLLVTGIIASLVALIGLNTWKKHLKGKVEYDLSRKLLTKTYRLRDLISFVRSSYMSGAEMQNPPDNSPFSKTEEGKRYYNAYTGYMNRFKPINETKARLLTDLLEAEALWGDSIRQQYNRLFHQMNVLVVEIESYLRDINPETRYRRDMPDPRIEQQLKIMYSREKVENDEYWQEFVSILNEIEKLIKPHLKILD